MPVDPQVDVFTEGVATAVAPSGDVVAAWSAYDLTDDLAGTSAHAPTTSTVRW